MVPYHSLVYDLVYLLLTGIWRPFSFLADAINRSSSTPSVVDVQHLKVRILDVSKKKSRAEAIRAPKSYLLYLKLPSASGDEVANFCDAWVEELRMSSTREQKALLSCSSHPTTTISMVKLARD